MNNSLAGKNMLRQLKIFLFDVLIIETGLMISGFGTALFYAAGLGSGAMATFSDGLHRLTGLSYGQANLAANVMFLLIMLILDRKMVNVGTVLCVFTIGAWVDLFHRVLSFPPLSGGVAAVFGTLMGRILLSSLGTLFMGAGLGLYVAVRRGNGALEGLVRIFSEKSGRTIRFSKILQDALLVAGGICMGASFGVGTIIGIALTGPVFQETDRRMEKRISIFKADHFETQD